MTDAAVGGSTVFGAVNATRVTGNVYLELSAGNAEFSSFTSTNASSVVGAYEANIGGNLDIVVNAGTLNYQILGGFHTATGGQKIGGNVNVYVNGGIVKGDVVGGGLTGAINGGTAVTVTNGKVTGNVYGGGKGGTIGISARSISMSTDYASRVTLTGGEVGGDVYGAGSGGTVNGNSGVLVSTSAVRLYDGSNWGNIYGGAGANGTVTGNSTVYLKDILTSTDAHGFDKYAGTISGGSNVAGTKTLIFDNVRLDGKFGATLSNFDRVSLTNGSGISLSSLGGATVLELGAGCILNLEGDYQLTSLLMGENSSLSLGSLLGDDVVVDITGVTNYTISLSNLNAGLDNITFKNGDQLFEAMLTNIDLQAGTGQLMALVPEPGTASLSLLGLAGLLLRRRR